MLNGITETPAQPWLGGSQQPQANYTSSHVHPSHLICGRKQAVKQMQHIRFARHGAWQSYVHERYGPRPCHGGSWRACTAMALVWSSILKRSQCMQLKACHFRNVERTEQRHSVKFHWNTRNRTRNIETIMVTTRTTVIIVTTKFDVHHAAPHARSPALAARSPSGHASHALPLRVTTHRHARL